MATTGGEPADEAKAPRTVVETTPGSTPHGSDTLEVFLIGFGTVLILFSALFDRIKKLDLPGGGGFELTPVSEAKLTKEIKRAKPDITDDELERAVRRAELEIAGKYWGRVVKPPDDVLANAAARAVS